MTQSPWPSATRARPALLLCAVLVVLAGTACLPGPYPLDFFQEMHYTAVQRRGEPNRAPAPPDSVPTSGQPPRLSFAQAHDLANPLPLNADTLAQGQQLVNVNCAVCHGPDGNGQPAPLLAPYYRDNPAAPVAPPAFSSPRVRGRTEGELYWIIDNGLGDMPAFHGLLSPTELWAVVTFVHGETGR